MIDNVTWTGDAGTVTATTRIGGITLTHEPDCALVANVGPHAEGFDQHSCSCYIQGVRLVEFPDGTVVPTPERDNTAHITWLREQVTKSSSWRRSDRRYMWIATGWGSLGWLYALARGIWGF